MKRIVIFDLDGTLLNTIDDLAAATNHALACCGYPVHPVSAYPYFVGNGIDKLFERALPPEARSATEIARMRASFVPYYNTHCDVYTRPYDGIVHLLERLQAAGIAIAVASNKYHEATRHLIAEYFPDIEFAAVYGQREGIPKKPDPAIVNTILSDTGFSTADTVYVGDSGVDMLTARHAGVESVGVTWGFRPVDELQQAGACHIAADTAELWGYIADGGK